MEIAHKVAVITGAASGIGRAVALELARRNVRAMALVEMGENIETVAAEDGTVSDGEGWTRLVVTPERGLRAVDGLLTGWHDPEASHLMLVESVAGPELTRAAYDAAMADGYLWHEFGDSALLLP